MSDLFWDRRKLEGSKIMKKTEELIPIKERICMKFLSCFAIFLKVHFLDSNYNRLAKGSLVVCG